MPLETCQMLAVVYSKWYYNWGNDLLPKKDGTPYNTEKGAFQRAPLYYLGGRKYCQYCLVNSTWFWITSKSILIDMVKIHSCQTAMNEAERVFEEKTGRTLLCHKEATPFAFAGPDVV